MTCSAEDVYGEKLSPPPCSVGLRDIRPVSTFEFKGPWPNMTSGYRTGFDSEHARGLADANTPIPESWNWYEKEPDKIENGRRNQGSCGSCWSFATVSALGDRYALKYNTKAPYPSVAFLLSCFDNAGLAPTGKACCCGGVVELAAEYLSENGTKLEVCWPYDVVTATTRSCPNIPIAYAVPPCLQTEELSKCCHTCCGTNLADVGFLVKKGSVKPLAIIEKGKVNVDATIAAIQRDIMANGPIATSMFVFGGTSLGDEDSEPVDFTTWWGKHAGTDAVFVPSDTSMYDGGHAVVIVGWGKSGDTRYWIVRNSWGSPGFYRQVMTTSDVPSDKRSGIDVPSLYDSEAGLSHGAVSFLPGDEHGKLPDNPYPFSPDSKTGINWKVVLPWGIGIILVIFLLIVIFGR